MYKTQESNLSSSPQIFPLTMKLPNRSFIINLPEMENSFPFYLAMMKEAETFLFHQRSL